MQASSQVFPYLQQFQNVGAPTSLSHYVPHPASGIFPHHQNMPSGWNFNFVENREVYSEYLYSRSLNYYQRKSLVPTHQFFHESFNDKKCKNLKVYSDDKETLDKPLDLSTVPDIVSNNSIIAHKAKEFNADDTPNQFNLRILNPNFTSNSFEKNKYILPFQENSENKEANSNFIYKNKNKFVCKNTKYINRKEEDICRKSLGIKKHVKYEYKTKYCRLAGKRIKLKEMTFQFSTESGKNNKSIKFNNRHQQPKSDCFQSITPKLNMCPPIYPTNKSTRLFKDNMISKTGINVAVRPDLNPDTKLSKVVSKKLLSFRKNNKESMQKSLGSDEKADTSRKDQNLENDKETSRVRKQNLFSLSILDVENVFNCQRTKYLSEPLDFRSSLKASEMRPPNPTIVEITPKFENTSSISVSEKEQLYSDCVNEKINLKETVDKQKESLHKRIAANKLKNRSLILRQVKKTLENLSKTTCERKLLQCNNNNCSTDNFINESNVEISKCGCNISSASWDLFNGHTICGNCGVVEKVIPLATSYNTVTNDSSENYDLRLPDYSPFCPKNTDYSNDQVLAENMVNSPCCDPCLSPTNKIADPLIESDLVITNSFSLSGFLDSISSEVPYIEHGCWKVADQV